MTLTREAFSLLLGEKGLGMRGLRQGEGLPWIPRPHFPGAGLHHDAVRRLVFLELGTQRREFAGGYVQVVDDELLLNLDIHSSPKCE